MIWVLVAVVALILIIVFGMYNSLIGKKNNVENAKKVGMLLGERLKAKKIKTAVFDRNGYPYHGIVKSIADGAREAGLKF